MHLNERKLLKCHVKVKTCRKWSNGQNIDLSEEKIFHKGFVRPDASIFFLSI